MEHQVDLTTPILCGVRNHRNLACSNAFSFDGYGAITPKIKPLPSWMGMMTPFQWPVWTLVFATLFAVTLTLGLFAKRSQPDKEIDWTLHFLDSLHPICGTKGMTSLMEFLGRGMEFTQSSILHLPQPPFANTHLSCPVW